MYTPRETEICILLTVTWGLSDLLKAAASAARAVNQTECLGIQAGAALLVEGRRS